MNPFWALGKTMFSYIIIIHNVMTTYYHNRRLRNILITQKQFQIDSSACYIDNKDLSNAQLIANTAL